MPQCVLSLNVPHGQITTNVYVEYEYDDEGRHVKQKQKKEYLADTLESGNVENDNAGIGGSYRMLTDSVDPEEEKGVRNLSFIKVPDTFSSPLFFTAPWGCDARE